MSKHDKRPCSICGTMTTSTLNLKTDNGYDVRPMCNDCLEEWSRRAKAKGIEHYKK